MVQDTDEGRKLPLRLRPTLLHRSADKVRGHVKLKAVWKNDKEQTQKKIDASQAELDHKLDMLARIEEIFQIRDSSSGLQRMRFSQPVDTHHAAAAQPRLAPVKLVKAAQRLPAEQQVRISALQ